MDWQAALRARLLAAAPVTALVGQRIYWMGQPQLSAMPAITIRAIREEYEQHMTGIQGFQEARVQIDIWSGENHSGRHGYDLVSDIARKVIAAVVPRATINGIRFDRASVEGVYSLDERDGATAVFHKAVDLIIRHSPA